MKSKKILTKKEEEKIKREMDETFQLKKELTYYKRKVQELRTKLQNKLYNTAVEDRIINAIYKKNIYIEPLKKYNITNKNVNREVMVLNLSDIHFGERVSKEEMGGLNEYNMSIAKKRIEKLTKSIISIVNILNQAYRIDELRIYALGDFINGLIHEELVETADGDLIDWLYDGAAIVSRMILEISPYFKKIKLIGVPGNHGEIRRNNKKVYKRKYVNWDYIIYKNIEFMCQKDKSIKFIIPKSFFYIDQIFDYKFLLLHGDNIRSWMGIPWYGIQRAVKNFHELLASKREYLDYVILGHFHNTGSLQTVSGEILINGSIIGGNEFSLGSLYSSNKPFQLLFGVHPKKGITFRYNIKLD